MTSNTEPIPVAQALRLCEMALTQTEGFDAQTGCCANCDLSRAVMRPLIELVKNAVVHAVYNDEVKQGDWIYPPLAALRDHYDKARPDWRKSK